MSRKEQVRAYKALKSFYREDPPVADVMNQLKLSADEAAELIDYVNNPPKRGRPPKIVVHSPNKKRDAISFIRWPMLLCGIAALVGSIYFMIDKLSQVQPMFIAVLIGTTLIGFGTMSFEVAVYQKQRKIKAWFAFIIAWVFIIIYSVTATTGSFYNRTLAKTQAKEQSTVVVSANKVLYDKYEQQIKDINTLIEDRRVKLTNFQSILGKYADPSVERGKEYTNAYWSADSFEKAIRAQEEEKKKLVGEQVVLLQKSPEIVKDAELAKVKDYSVQIAYIFRAFHWDASVIQFIIDTIPSMLLDVISSLSFYVFLFLGKNPIDSSTKNQYTSGKE